ncbi:MAG: hypothetical protein ABJN14_06665 [Paracoccaceae bacterium]
MSDAYEYGIQAGVDRRKDLDRKALNALWDGASGDHAGVIVQLRQRGDHAARGAKYILWSLALVIFLGLAFYLGQPFARLWVDGERIALSRHLEDTKTAAAALRVEMDAQRQSYEDALADSVEVIETPSRPAALYGHVEIDGGLLLYGGVGTLLRIASDGTAADELLDTPIKALLLGHVEIDRGLLFYGDNGTLFRTASDGGAASGPLNTPNEARLWGHVEIDGGLLLYGENGMLFRTAPDGTAAGEPMDTPNGAALNGYVEIDEGLLFYGDNGTLFRTAPDGTAAGELVETPNDDSLYGHAEIDGGLLFYGDNGTLFRTAPDGSAAGELLDTPNEAVLNGHAEIDGGLLFYGQDRTLFRTAPDGSAASQLLDTPNNVWLRGHAKIDHGLLFYGVNAGPGIFLPTDASCSEQRQTEPLRTRCWISRSGCSILATRRSTTGCCYMAQLACFGPRLIRPRSAFQSKLRLRGGRLQRGALPIRKIISTMSLRHWQ